MNTIPLICTLEEMSERTAGIEGVTLEALEPYVTIRVQTHNSDYEIFLLDPKTGRALVRGGRYLQEPVEAIVNGSTLGGCMLKIGWLGVGLQMEIYVNGCQLVTTPVQALQVVNEIAALQVKAAMCEPLAS